MPSIIIKNTMDLEETFRLMQEDARYDIQSSAEALESSADQIRQTIRTRKALPKTPKIFLSNECAFNCAYCGCRSGNDCKRTYLTSPRALADFSMDVVRQYRGGIFLSSAIFRTPDYTAELINETLRILREEHRYGGYIHAKVMPGTDPELIRAAGRYADRLSVNIEVAQSDGYSKIAKNKNKKNILTPMGHISRMIQEAKAEQSAAAPRFATSQSTQMMVGSTGEDDHTILQLAGALYKKYHLRRVYYTAFDFREPAAGYENLSFASTPNWRVHRLYQADRLMQNYGFGAEELSSPSLPNLRQDLDPKADWALRNLHLFPMEVNTAEYEQLLKVPGIGVTYATRILEARKLCTVTHHILSQLGIPLKKCRHFITCNGKYTGIRRAEASTLYPLLADTPWEVDSGTQLYFQGKEREPAMVFRPLHA